MKNVVTQPFGIHFPVLSLDLHAGVQCCAFFCESLLFNTQGHSLGVLQFCRVTSASGPFLSQNKNNQVAIE
ncbi:hypothetical protein AO286_17105 [Pseudomonas syringae]|uniref:Uncharacterized protein n=3 Tax=Pseudomonas syringae group TaxID=136849 RepID=A0A0Q0G5G5_PSESX|nr:hypothetical protein PSPTO_1816 [Pseudomonas syringae pv. tomato str. DC3000]KKI23605.1 hypothetical protein WX98_23270 [Pseudomonas syringae pv. persicae]KPB94273.1 Uncharacterized protein AC502_3067 [Pseudomonas syringae pv. maculicola]KPB96918.1 Uncharacterized protein AC506_1703 [Pseudomonas syringae pv. maculicola str. M6]KPZ08460.1 Uncharacterized protein ALO94_01062 [Pseudomonas syringae pv. spinaceae]KTB99010.1 hypothetical protein AO386_16305 [Pseudomonas syringae ICMP 11292]KWT05